MNPTHPDHSAFRWQWLNVRLQLVAILVGFLAAGPALALPEDREKELLITADRSKRDSEKTHFEGDVHLTQGTLEVWADTLDVYQDPESGDISYLEAHGEPARLQTLPEPEGDLLKVRGLRIEYRPDEGIVIAEKEGMLEQAGNLIEAYYLEYTLEDESLDVRSERAHTGQADAPQATWTIQPEALD